MNGIAAKRKRTPPEKPSNDLQKALDAGDAEATQLKTKNQKYTAEELSAMASLLVCLRGFAASESELFRRKHQLRATDPPPTVR